MNENFEPDFVELYLHGVFLGIYTKENLSLEYHGIVGNILEAKVVEGFGGREFTPLSYEEEVFKGLRSNVWVFSAAKQYQQVRLMSNLVNDQVSFTDFKKAAMVIWDDFNLNYLKTEYNTAFGQAQMAKDWVRSWTQREELPMITYHTQRDARVRDEHAILDGITLPVGDKFWNSYMPKNGWNCRCFTTQHEETKATDLSQRDLSELNDEKKFPPIFKMNPGKDKIIFSPKHPYFKVAKGDGELKKNNFNLPVK